MGKGASSGPLSIAELCRNARKDKGWTIMTLAKVAKVSSASVNIIEKDRIKTAMAGGNQTRKKMLWAKVIQKLTWALNVEDPKLWLKAAGIELTKGQDAKIKADLKQMGARGETVDVRLITLEEEDGEQTRFYRSFVGTLLKVINPCFSPKMEPCRNTLTELQEGLSVTKPVNRLIVGFCEIASRSFQGFEFIPFPGLRVGLSILAQPEMRLSQAEVQRFRPSLEAEGQLKLCVIVIAGELGDLYVSSYCAFPRETIVSVSKYDLKQAAAVFHDKLVKENRVIFIVGQYEGSLIQKRLREQYGTEVIDIAKDLRGQYGTSTDTAIGRGDEIPHFRLAIATTDNCWAAVLRKGVFELFMNTPELVANMYAGWLAGAIDAAIDAVLGAKGNRGEVFRSSIVDLGRLSQPQWPIPIPGNSSTDREPSVVSPASHLVLHEMGITIPPSFPLALEEALKRELVEKRHYLSGEEFGRYFSHLTPGLSVWSRWEGWLKSSLYQMVTLISSFDSHGRPKPSTD